MNTQSMTASQRLDAAKKIVRNYSIGSVAPAVVPIPMVDLALLTSLQLKMLHSLSNVYGVKFSKNLGKEAITSLVGGVAPVAMTPGITSMIKIIPLVGQVAGAISLGTLGTAATYAIGKVFIQHFESGGTFLTFDPAKVREHFAKEMEEGKKLAEDTQENKATAAA